MTARHGQYRLVAAKELPAKVRIPLYSNHSGHSCSSAQPEKVADLLLGFIGTTG